MKFVKRICVLVIESVLVVARSADVLTEHGNPTLKKLKSMITEQSDLSISVQDVSVLAKLHALYKNAVYRYKRTKRVASITQLNQPFFIFVNIDNSTNTHLWQPQ